MTASERIREARERAAGLVCNQSTARLVESFSLTDALLEQGSLRTDQFLSITTTRGWIIEELVKRGEAHLIGL